MVATVLIDHRSKGLIKAIQTCRRQVVGLDDDPTWRAWLRNVVNEDSLRKMSEGKLTRVLDALRESGAKRGPSQGKRPVAEAPIARKARAMWMSLWQLGAIDDERESALTAFGKRQLGVDDLRWADPTHADPLIEALKAWCKREGFNVAAVKIENTLGEPEASAPDAMTRALQARLIDAQWEKLVTIGAFKHGHHARLDTWLMRMGFAVSHQCFLNASRQRDAIDELGQFIRRVKTTARASA